MLVDAGPLSRSCAVASEHLAIGLPVDDPALNSLLVALTACQYLGLLLFAGLVFFGRCILTPAQNNGAAGRGIAGTGLLVGGMATVFLVPVTALRIAGVPLAAMWDPGRWQAFVYPPSIHSLLVLLLAAPSAVLAASREPGKWRRAVLPLIACLCLAVPAFSGHTRSQKPAWLMITADLVHLGVAAVWLGGLLGLLLLLGRPGAVGMIPAQEAAATVVRFSGFALASLVLLAASGTVMALLILERPEELLDGTYGRLLLLKFGLVISAALVAAWNRFYLLDRLVSGRADEWSTLRRTLAYEALILVVAVGISAALTNTGPGHTH